MHSYLTDMGEEFNNENAQLRDDESFQLLFNHCVENLRTNVLNLFITGHFIHSSSSSLVFLIEGRFLL